VKYFYCAYRDLRRAINFLQRSQENVIAMRDANQTVPYSHWIKFQGLVDSLVRETQELWNDIQGQEWIEEVEHQHRKEVRTA